jgi:hypothetical protein
MAENTLPHFPDAFLTPRDTYIYGKAGEWAIIIGLQPFELDGETVKTTVSLDSFPWDVERPRELAGATHEYSADDRCDQNIEGSVYLRHAHHPVDVSRVAFGRADADGVQVTVDCDLDFDFEGGGFKNRAARIACRLKFGEPKDRSYRIIR